MKFEFDPDVDAAYLLLQPAKIIESEEVVPGIIYDFDDQDIRLDVVHKDISHWF